MGIIFIPPYYIGIQFCPKCDSDLGIGTKCSLFDADFWCEYKLFNEEVFENWEMRVNMGEVNDVRTAY